MIRLWNPLTELISIVRVWWCTYMLAKFHPLDKQYTYYSLKARQLCGDISPGPLP